MIRVFDSDEVFNLADALAGVDDKPAVPTIDERPGLLELYSRRSRRIRPTKQSDKGVWPTAFIVAFGSIVYFSLVMCLG